MPRALFGPKSLNGLSGNIHRQGARQTKSNQSWVCVPSCWADSMSARVWVWVCTIVATHSHSVARQIHYNFPLPFSPLSLSHLPSSFLVASWSVRAKTHAPRISALHFLWSHCWCCCYCWHAHTPHRHINHTDTHTYTHRQCRTGTGPKWNQFKCAPMCRVWIMITNVLHSLAVNVLESVCVYVCVCECKWAAQGTGKICLFRTQYASWSWTALCCELRLLLLQQKAKKRKKKQKKVPF